MFIIETHKLCYLEFSKNLDYIIRHYIYEINYIICTTYKKKNDTLLLSNISSSSCLVCNQQVKISYNGVANFTTSHFVVFLSTDSCLTFCGYGVEGHLLLAILLKSGHGQTGWLFGING